MIDLARRLEFGHNANCDRSLPLFYICVLRSALIRLIKVRGEIRRPAHSSAPRPASDRFWQFETRSLRIIINPG